MKMNFEIPAFDDSKISIREQSTKILEDASRLCEAVRNYEKVVLKTSKTTDARYVHVSAHLLVFAMADVLQTVVNLAYAFGIDEDIFDEFVAMLVDENEEKGMYRNDNHGR